VRMPRPRSAYSQQNPHSSARLPPHSTATRAAQSFGDSPFGEFALPARHFALLLGMLLAALDQTIVAIALPTVAGDLRPCRTCPGASQQPHSVSDTDEELPTGDFSASSGLSRGPMSVARCTAVAIAVEPARHLEPCHRAVRTGCGRHEGPNGRRRSSSASCLSRPQRDAGPTWASGGPPKPLSGPRRSARSAARCWTRCTPG